MKNIFDYPWFNRQAPVWGAAILIATAAGILAAIQVGSFSGATLGTAACFLAMAPVAAAISAWLAIGFRGLNSREVRDAIAQRLDSRKPDRAAKPILFLLYAAGALAAILRSEAPARGSPREINAESVIPVVALSVALMAVLTWSDGWLWRASH